MQNNRLKRLMQRLTMPQKKQSVKASWTNLFEKSGSCCNHNSTATTMATLTLRRTMGKRTTTSVWGAHAERVRTRTALLSTVQLFHPPLHRPRVSPRVAAATATTSALVVVLAKATTNSPRKFSISCQLPRMFCRQQYLHFRKS